MSFRAGIATGIVASLVTFSGHAQAPAAEPAVAPAVVVADVIQSFDNLCLESGANREAMLKQIPDDGVNGKVLPSKLTEDEQGAPGGISWYVRTPHKILVKVESTPAGICSVEVPVVDTVGLGKALTDLLASGQKSGAIRFAVKADKRETQGNMELHRIFYMVDQKKLGTVGYLAIKTEDGGQLDEHRGTLSYVLTTDAFSDKKDE